MRTCRIKYTVLGLLVYYLQCAFTWSCASDFEDVASKTVMADLVFEGRPLNKFPLNGNHGYYYYNFRIVSLIKGNFSNTYISSFHPHTTTSPSLSTKGSNKFLFPVASHENDWSQNRVRTDNNPRQFPHSTYPHSRRPLRLEPSQRSYYRPQRRPIRSVTGAPRSKLRRRIVGVKMFGAVEDISECVASASMSRHKTYLVFLRLPKRFSLPSVTTTRRQTTTHHAQHKPYSVKRSKESWRNSSNPRLRTRYRRSLNRNRRTNKNRKVNYKSEIKVRMKKKVQKAGPKRSIYMISSTPVLSTKSVKAAARHHGCLDCKQKAKVLSISSQKKVVIGKGVNLTCRVSGFPRPEVYWLRNGLVLAEEHISIESRRVNISRVDSVLVLEDSTENDTGQYQCFGVNVVGESKLVKTSINIVSRSKKPFSERCANQHYCFNHGECFKLTDREAFFCQCKEDYVGDRCQERNTGHHVLLMGRRKRRRRSSHKHPSHNNHAISLRSHYPNPYSHIRLTH